MSIIGSLEEFVAQLYPLRWLVLFMGLTLVSAGLYAVARFRLYRPMMRRKGVTLAIGVPVLALMIGAGWFLGSPLFTRASLDEANPLQATSAQAAAPARGTDAGSLAPARQAGGSGAAQAAATPAAKAAPGAKVLRSGDFRGADEFHFGRGKVSVIETEPGRFVLRFDQFSVRNGPDLRVYLSPKADGYDRGALQLGKLKATDGSFNYDIPAGTDLSQFKSVVIWCQPFSVLFATAPLS